MRYRFAPVTGGNPPSTKRDGHSIAGQVDEALNQLRVKLATTGASPIEIADARQRVSDVLEQMRRLERIRLLPSE